MWSPGEWKSPTVGDEAPFRGLLEESVDDFVNSRGFGYIKDRRHVAGFVSHRFSRVPEPAARWTVRNLDLVSLLLHDEPEVYVSDQLPEMDKMHGTPTRPLDRFERFGLETLERGEDLFISEAGDGLRMLGAVRSVKQCVDATAGAGGTCWGRSRTRCGPGRREKCPRSDSPDPSTLGNRDAPCGSGYLFALNASNDRSGGRCWSWPNRREAWIG